ncbi:MAG TPA: phosphate signaling complex protein PhoU [Candidatus Dormibacteraeota bacterium]|nr:phosphate signaling complex protein PhoU [Candidatus Dormibacteraeota bacterium]
MARTAYHEALERTRLDVLRMGALAEEAVRNSIAAMDRRDTELARRVIAGDDTLDDLRRKVEAACIELLWRQQPLASELRTIAAMLETIVDLERVGDYGVEIAKRAIAIADMPVRPANVEILKMGTIAADMLHDVVTAFSDQNVELCQLVIDRDDEVDIRYHNGIRALQVAMEEDSRMVAAATQLLFTLSSVERIGDRAQNIAWHVKEMLV